MDVSIKCVEIYLVDPIYACACMCERTHMHILVTNKKWLPSCTLLLNYLRHWIPSLKSAYVFTSNYNILQKLKGKHVVLKMTAARPQTFIQRDTSTLMILRNKQIHMTMIVCAELVCNTWVDQTNSALYQPAAILCSEIHCLFILLISDNSIHFSIC